MGINEKPNVYTLADGSKAFEHTYENFEVKGYVPKNNLKGNINNYGFKAPLLVVLEENKLSIEDAAKFADDTGLADIAAENDATVLFVYPTCEGGWDNTDERVYVDFIAEVKLSHMYEDGIVKDCGLFGQEFNGYFLRGTKFRTAVYSFGKSADFAAKHLLKTIQGEYLWGPGEITPAMVSMERLSVMPCVERNDIPVISIGNSQDYNSALKNCKNILIKEKAEYKSDFKSFVRKFKMWCGEIVEEPDLEAMNMTEEAGTMIVHTSKDNFGAYKDTKEHEIGYFAYYNNDIFDNGPAPLVIGFHGAGDSSMFLTYVSGWYEVAHKYGFLFVSFENHMDIPAEEVMEALEEIKRRYKVDEHRIYAVGFSMGCGKTWDLFEQYPTHFAAIAPASALFPVYSNPFGRPVDVERINKSVPLPIFYSGGDKSHVSELPCQSAWAVERLKYAAEVNKLVKKFDITFEDCSNWTDPVMGIKGDRVERLYDESRDAYLNINYYDSEDGVCRTAFAVIENQQHEYRQHTADKAWQFISKFTR
ncbi:MAG: hypothetical protein MJ133_01765 [Lachnospiraceae bacterium]|nr:hypothetical protein [Lachnospiraceae bacterium]